MNVMFSGKVKAAVKGDDKDKVVTAAIDAGADPAEVEGITKPEGRRPRIIIPTEQPTPDPASESS